MPEFVLSFPSVLSYVFIKFIFQNLYSVFNYWYSIMQLFLTIQKFRIRTWFSITGAQ